MKLLLITQALDSEDPVLSVYVRWVEEISSRFESVHVICLKEGKHDLPPNIIVHSLGKEEGVGRLTYLYRFYSYIWSLRHEYEVVFVHMNQEYILLAGWLWKAMGKRVYMWRNHYAGSLLTDITVAFCTKVFCTSKHSYTAQFKRTKLMPVGIDLVRFEGPEMVREPRSILFLGRIAPSKRPEMLIDALGEVLARGISFTASIYGSPSTEDISYFESLDARAESLGLHDRVRFYPGVPNETAPAIYRTHDIFVNCSPSGMFDKTIFEAAACGCRVLAASDDFHDMAGDRSFAPTTADLAERLIESLTDDDDTITRRRIELTALARGESLGTLADRLSIELSQAQPEE